MQPHTPLETLGLVGAVRARITDTDRAWMNTALASEEGSFECMDGGERGLLLAWRRPGTAPESASLGKSISGTQQVLVAGRVEYPSRSADDLANVLERDGESAWSSIAGPCIVMAWSDRDGEYRFFRPASGQRNKNNVAAAGRLDSQRITSRPFKPAPVWLCRNVIFIWSKNE